MTKQEFLEYCYNTYGTSADYPFEGDFETAVLRHGDNRKWYAIVMRVPRRKLCGDGDEAVDVVNLKVPITEYGAYDAVWGVYPAYHMNKRHWVSVLISEVSEDVICHLVGLSFDATKSKRSLL